MAYTRTWDEAYPPDTQQANLLGQDLRNGKVDLRERIASFGAGLLVDRPTPEAAFAGVIYIAMDTSQVFRWSGVDWQDITANITALGTIYRNNALILHAGSTTEDTIYTIPIPPLDLSSVIRGRVAFFVGAQGALTTNLRVYLEGDVIVALGFSSALAGWTGSVVILDFALGNRNSFTGQITTYNIMTNGGVQNTGVIGTAVDTSVATTMTIKMDNGQGIDSQNFEQCLIRLA